MSVAVPAELAEPGPAARIIANSNSSTRNRTFYRMTAQRSTAPAFSSQLVANPACVPELRTRDALIRTNVISEAPSTLRTSRPLTITMLAMEAKNALQTAINDEEFAIVHGLLADESINHHLTTLEDQATCSVLQKQGNAFAVRNLLDLPERAGRAHSAPLRNSARTVLGEFFFPVNGAPPFFCDSKLGRTGATGVKNPLTARITSSRMVANGPMSALGTRSDRARSDFFLTRTGLNLLGKARN